MTENNTSVTDAPTFRVYNFDTPYWRDLVNRARAKVEGSGTDERGAYVKVKLVKAEAITVFGERR